MNSIEKGVWICKRGGGGDSFRKTGGWVGGGGNLNEKTDELPKIYFPLSPVPNSSFTIFTAHRSPHIEQVSMSPSRQWIFFAWSP